MLKINTFSLILQKIINDNIVYNVDYDEYDTFNVTRITPMLYFKLIQQIVMKPEKIYSLPGIIHHTICIFIARPDSSIKESKIEFLYKVNKNPFFQIDQIDAIYSVFITAWRHYRILTRFANKWRHLHTPLHNDSDLYLNPILPHPTNNMSILQNGQKYIFTAGNLINITNGALGNAPMFFAEPLAIKNPYNNIPFSKSILYNMYFFLKQTTFIMPNLFHMYFKCNFDLREFRDKNEGLLRDYALDAFIKNTPTETLAGYIRSMLQKRRFRCIIHDEFPTELLVEIFRPYLRLYYISMYALEQQKQNNADYELTKRLNYFSQYNRLFGRKYFYRELGKRRFRFNDKYPPFIKNIQEVCDNFRRSHIETIEITSSWPRFNNHSETAEFTSLPQYDSHSETIEIATLISHFENQLQMREREGLFGSEGDEDEEINDERPDSMRGSTSRIVDIIIGTIGEDSGGEESDVIIEGCDDSTNETDETESE